MCGVTIGEIKKNYVLPHHQLFMAYGKDFKRKIELAVDSDDIQKYLHGEYECDEVYYERQSFARVFYGTVSHFTKLAKRALFNK